MVAYWSIKSNPNLKQNQLTSYKDLVRFDWETTRHQDAKRDWELSKGRFKEKLDG